MLFRASSRFLSMVEGAAPMVEIAAYLDGLSPLRRVEEVRSVRGGLVGKLYELARGTEGLTLGDVVAESTPAGATVAFEGRNSLPTFSRFQKRFTRTADGVVFGHNAFVASAATGPGYFTVKVAGDEHPGELWFDYTEAPPFEPAGWPRYVNNQRLLSRFVYSQMHDFVRRVARGVMVGTAYKLGVEQNAWFTLTMPR